MNDELKTDERRREQIHFAHWREEPGRSKWVDGGHFCLAGTLWDDGFPETLSFHFEFECKMRIFRKHRGVCFDLPVE